MVQISDLIIQHPEVTSFDDLEKLVVEAARNGEVHLYFDLKPDYPDTPRGWEKRLELAFCYAERRNE